MSSKSGARSPTLLPIFAVTTGTAVAVGGTGVAVGGMAVAVGGTGVDVGGTGVDGGPEAVAELAYPAGPVSRSVEPRGLQLARRQRGVGSVVDVGAIGAPEGAPVYTADAVGEGWDRGYP